MKRYTYLSGVCMHTLAAVLAVIPSRQLLTSKSLPLSVRGRAPPGKHAKRKNETARDPMFQLIVPSGRGIGVQGPLVRIRRVTPKHRWSVARWIVAVIAHPQQVIDSHFPIYRKSFNEKGIHGLRTCCA